MSKRFYADYRDWEDFKNGMYGKEVRLEFVEHAKNLLLNPIEAMRQVINNWPVSTRHNLTNSGSNRKSWLGQSACNIAKGCFEFETRMAWKELTKEQQFYANQCADTVIKEWELANNFIKIKHAKDLIK
jgi:hypothetical protein